jgi:hypothetical protein
VGSQSEVSLANAARAVYGSRLFWPVSVLVAVLSALPSLLPSIPWSLIAFSGPILLAGYQISIARAVFEGKAVLPSPAKDPKTLVRRGLSLELILVVIVIVPMIIIPIVLIALPFPTIRWFGPAAYPLFTTLLVAVFIPIEMIVRARYVAFDQLSEGFRYWQAWRRFRAHSRAGLRVIGYVLIAFLLRTALRYAILWPLDLFSISQRTAARAQIVHGSSGRGLILLGVEVGLAALWAPWLLISAHLMGQFVSVAYADDYVEDWDPQVDRAEWLKPSLPLTDKSLDIPERGFE